MKKITALLLAASLCGCINLAERSESSEKAPYCCAAYPYCCTVAVATEVLPLPFQGKSGPDAVLPAAVAVTYPLWVVDTVLEAVLDTVFLPVDAITYAVKNGKNDERRETGRQATE